MKFINIGFGNMVADVRIVAIASPESAPIKRLVQDARDAGRVIDVSCGRRTRAVIVTDSDHIILSAIQSETIASRLHGENSPGENSPGENSPIEDSTGDDISEETDTEKDTGNNKDA